MPGPGLDLYGEEELAELADVIRARRVSRYGPDDASFPAKVRTLEEEVCRLQASASPSPWTGPARCCSPRPRSAWVPATR